MPTVVRLSWLLILSATTAGGSPVPTSLDYRRGPGADACPDEDEARRRLAARLGREALTPGAERVLHVELVRAEQQLEATLRLVDNRGELLGERRLSGPLNCQELAASVELAMALAIDPLFTTPPPPPPAPEPVAPRLPEPPAPPSEPEVRVVEVVREPPPATHWLELRAVMLGTLASTHLATAALAAGGAWKSDATSWGFELRAQLPTQRSLFGGTLSSTVAMASFVPCGKSGLFRFCGVGSGGAVWSQASDLPGAGEAVTPWLSAGGRIEVALPLAGGTLVGLLELALPLVRTRVRVEPLDIWATPVVGGALGAGYAYDL